MTGAIDRLGTGWAFPPMPGVTSHELAWRSGPELVRQSIRLILDTEPGERVMRPTFGCGLQRFLMEPNTPTTRAAIAREVEAALRAYEPRIEVLAVQVDPTQDPGTVVVSIAYAHTRDRTQAQMDLPMTFSHQGGT